jgi:hypothetical protein
MTIQITKNVPNYPPDDLRPKTFDLGPGSEDAVLHLRRFVPTAKEKALSGQWNVVAIHEDGKKLDSAITLDIPGIKPDGEAEVYHKQLLLPDALIFTNSHNQCDSWGKTGNAYGWSKYMLDASDDPEKIHFYTSNKAWYLRVKLQQGVMPGEPADNKTPLEFSGIYRIENDGKRLTIAFREGGAPPEKFESTPGSGVTLFELEKNESPKPEKKESSIVPLIPGK